jgi:hypothetical protein
LDATRHDVEATWRDLETQLATLEVWTRRASGGKRRQGQTV